MGSLTGVIGVLARRRLSMGKYQENRSVSLRHARSTQPMEGLHGAPPISGSHPVPGTAPAPKSFQQLECGFDVDRGGRGSVGFSVGHGLLTF